MRPFDDEMDVRREQRQRYFEDPSYRKWSDIQRNSARMLYEGTTDDDFFIDYLFGDCENKSYSPDNIRNQMNKGKELPINWDALYAYFDERFNNPENGLKHQLINQDYYTSSRNDGVSLMELLNEYRDVLLQPIYDIV